MIRYASEPPVDELGLRIALNGITRSTRIAKLAPGTTIRVEVIGKLRRAYGGEPKVGDFQP